MDNSNKNKEKKKIVMIVEDDFFVMDIYQTKLNQEGYEVIQAENGEEALQKIEKEKPDLILLDIIMPQLDGLQVLKRIKADEKLIDRLFRK